MERIGLIAPVTRHYLLNNLLDSNEIPKLTVKKYHLDKNDILTKTIPIFLKVRRVYGLEV